MRKNDLIWLTQKFKNRKRLARERRWTLPLKRFDRERMQIVWGAILLNKILRNHLFTDLCNEIMHHSMSPLISIYKLTDLSDLSNLIGSLSRTIQQYSPSGEWIMWELGAFPKFLRKRSFKNRQNPWVDVIKARKGFERSKTAFFSFTVAEFCFRWIVYSRLFA